MYKVILYCHNYFHDNHCRRSGRGLFSTSFERLDLHLGRRKCWAQVRQILRFHCGLVVLYCMDDIHRRKFAGQRLSRFVIPSYLLRLISSFLIYQTAANYIVSQLAVWEINFPGGTSNDNIKWRALIWAISECLLIFSVAINYLPPRLYSAVFRFSIFIIMLDFFLCLIWLPIGVSRTYGFRSAEDVFTMSCMLSSRTFVIDD